MTHDERRLLCYGLLTAALMGMVLVPILMHDPKFPKSIAELILGAIALAVFGFSRLIGRRKSN
jgi:uncharacterized membrane protein